MNKRIFIILAFILLTFGFFAVGCGGGGDGSTADAGSNDDGTTIVSENPDPLSSEGDLDGDGVANKDDDDADADGFKNDVDCNDLDDSINPDIVDYPDGGSDVNCDGLDGDVDSIYVSAAEGNDANPGTIDEPVQSVSKGVELAKADPSAPKDVYVAQGNYKEDVWLTNNVNIFGGFGSLSDGKRARDVASFETFIDGAYDDVKATFTGKSNVMDFNCAVFVDGSDSILDGLTIEGSKDGAVIYIRNSSATISNSTVNTYKPTLPRKTSFAIIVTTDGNAGKDNIVTIQDNDINMFGTEDSNEQDFGIIAIPEKNADLALELNVLKNNLISTGKTGGSVAVFAADDQETPIAASKAGDARASISLNVEQNRFEMSGDMEMAAAVIAGGMGGSNSILPASEMDFHLASVNVSGNVILVGAAGASYGVSLMDIRGDAVVSNNAITIDNLANGGGMGVVSSNARLKMYYNTVNANFHDGGYGLAFFASEGSSGEYKLYSKFTPQNIYNNIFSIIADPNCNMVAGVIETGDSAALSYYSSPNEFKNNDIYMPVECADPSKSVFYADTFSPLTLIQVGSDLNDESKYAASNPTVFDGNIFEDPKFTDASNGDLSLKSSSPCIDAGLDFEDGWSDILGSSRPVGAGVDMGVIEQ